MKFNLVNLGESLFDLKPRGVTMRSFHTEYFGFVPNCEFSVGLYVEREGIDGG